MGLSIDEGGVRSRRGSVLAGGSDMLGEENKPGLGDLSHQLSLGGQLSRNAKRKSQRKKKKSKDKDLDDWRKIDNDFGISEFSCFVFYYSFFQFSFFSGFASY